MPAGPSQATGKDNDPQANASSYSNANSDARSASESAANAGSESSAAASADNNVVDSERNPDDIKIRNVASPDTPNPYPTAPCRVGVSAGLSLAGGALSGGGSVEDTECTLRETARSFKDLGVPEVGLYLLCTQSAVVNGRLDKKGELEEGQRDPLGAVECLRLVREFQGDSVAHDVERAHEAQLEKLREQQDTAQQRLLERVEHIENEISKPQNKPVVKQEVIQQPYLTEEKRMKLAAVLEEEITKSGDDNE